METFRVEEPKPPLMEAGLKLPIAPVGKSGDAQIDRAAESIARARAGGIACAPTGNHGLRRRIG